MTRLIPLALLGALTAGPALAQAPICGGISLVGQWIGGEAAASDLVGRTDAWAGEGQVLIAGHLVRMFTLSAPADIRIDARALPSGDPYAAVYDAAGMSVADDDDSLGDYGARMEASLQPGSYCLAVRSYEPGVTDVAVAIGTADARFPAVPVPDNPRAGAGEDLLPRSGATGTGCFEPDTPRLADGLDAAALGAGVEATATVGDVSAYGFDLAAPAPLTVTATSGAGDPLIRLLDAAGTVLAENDDFDGLDARIELGEALAAGDYCVEIEDLNGAENAVTVALGLFDPAADRARRLAAAEFAPTAADTVEIVDLGALRTSALREIAMASGTRWFRFDLPSGGLLLTEAIGDGADPVVTLFDRVGRRVGENDDGPDGLDSQLVSRLLPGPYTLAVRVAGGGAGSGTVRLLLERYVPAE